MPETVDVIREAQCNFLSFLWKNIIAINEIMAEGRFYRALVRYYWLIRGLPEEFQDKHKLTKEITDYYNEVNKIHSDGYTVNLRERQTEAMRNIRAEEILCDFVPKFSILLDKRGYMEKKGPNIEYGHE